MKRFLLFSFDSFYPSGGWEDYKGDFDTIEAAKEASGNENAHVVDMESGEITASRAERMDHEDDTWESGKP